VQILYLALLLGSSFYYLHRCGGELALTLSLLQPLFMKDLDSGRRFLPMSLLTDSIFEGSVPISSRAICLRESTFFMDQLRFSCACE
jgi:hypothetical protein